MSENTAYRVETLEPRQYSYVRYDVSGEPAEFRDHFNNGRLEFSPKHRYIYLGEIPNLLDRCIVTDDAGNTYAGHRTENFVELTEDEIDDFAPVGYAPK